MVILHVGIWLKKHSLLWVTLYTNNSLCTFGASQLQSVKCVAAVIGLTHFRCLQLHTYRLSVFSQQENIMERILVILTTILNFVDILVLATSHHQIFDLSHDYHETMPVGDGGGPPEISLVELEEENGLR